MRERLSRWDSLIFRAERILVAALFLLMGFVVFVDVLHRVFSRAPGRLTELSSGRISEQATILITILAVFILAIGAIKTSLRTRGLQKSWMSVLSLAATWTAGLSVVVYSWVVFVPQGIVWSPYFGLSALLWVGMIGASMASHRDSHLKLEMGEKLWPKRARPTVKSISRITVSLFCFVIATLGAESVLDHFRDWRSGPGAGLVPSIEWPKWIIFLVIPYAFGMMSLRSLAQALRLLPEAKQ